MNRQESAIAKRDAALARIEEGVKTCLDSDKWRSYLAMKTKLYRYSFRNTLLIWLQRPDARIVKGFKAWQKAGRQVKANPYKHDPDPEVAATPWGITILAPLTKAYYKEIDGKKERCTYIKGWTTATVFDIAQTEPIEGVEAEEFVTICPFIEGDREDIWLKLIAFAETQGIQIHESKKIEGFYSPGTHSITVGAYPTYSHKSKTLAHELGHALMHSNAVLKGEDRPRHVEELEAESVAFCVASHFGLDTSSYTFEYLASWAGEDAALILQSSGSRIKAATQTIIEGCI